MEKLMYGAKEMKFEPINIELDNLLKALKGDRPAVVILEPGDATRYRLLIVPCWAHEIAGQLGDVGVLDENEYLMVSKFDTQGGQLFFAHPHVQSYDLEMFESEWTRVLLAWWLRQLWTYLY